MKIALLFGLLLAVHGYDPEQIRQGFIDADHNGDGFVQLKEVSKTFGVIDANADGVITFQEYSRSEAPETPQNVAQGRFKYYDKLDGTDDNLISLMISSRLFSILDSDKNGKVPLAEYQKTIPQVLDGMAREIAAVQIVG